jgi:hypothetical protein
MVSITLSADEIRAAPPEVRRWLEQQILRSFPARTDAPPVALHGDHVKRLAALTPEEVHAVLQQIDTSIPTVGVFFELGREPAASSSQGVRMLRAPDVMSHARLRLPAQLLECLEAINLAARTVRDDEDALLCGIDPAGNCFITEETARSIVATWHEIVGPVATEQPPETPPS